MQVVEISSDRKSGAAETGGVRRSVRFDLIENVAEGDYVLIHAGYAIQKLSPEDAAESLELLREFVAAGEEGDDVVHPPDGGRGAKGG